MKFLFGNLLAMCTCDAKKEHQSKAHRIFFHIEKPKLNALRRSMHRTIVRRTEKMANAKQTKETNLILFNNISADFTQIN